MYQYTTLPPEVLDLMKAIGLCVPIVLIILVAFWERRDLRRKEKEVDKIKDSCESFRRESAAKLAELSK